jgi:hypothetical protein
MWSNMQPQVVTSICQAVQRIYQNRSAVLKRLNQKT